VNAVSKMMGSLSDVLVASPSKIPNFSVARMIVEFVVCWSSNVALDTHLGPVPTLKKPRISALEMRLTDPLFLAATNIYSPTTCNVTAMSQASISSGIDVLTSDDP